MSKWRDREEKERERERRDMRKKTHGNSHEIDTDRERTHSNRALNVEKERLQKLNTASVVISRFIST